jgi:1-acyl-sn-glycerol-3-phosphate acyltransferase
MTVMHNLVLLWIVREQSQLSLSLKRWLKAIAFAQARSEDFDVLLSGEFLQSVGFRNSCSSMATTEFLRALWRLLRCLLCVAGGLMRSWILFPWLDASGRMNHVQRWSQSMLRCLGVKMSWDGPVHPCPVLWVANHVSWLDILALNSIRPARFVAKSEIQRWPLLGGLVASAGTLFIERERKRDAVRVVHHIAEALTAGDRVAIFPEGTTSDGVALLPFHANLLQAAISTGTPVQALSLRYLPSHAAAYIDQMTLLSSLWKVVSCEELVLTVTVLPPVTTTTHNDRRALATRLEQEIQSAL